MTLRRWSVVAAFWVLSLLAVGAVVSAQVKAWRPIPEPKVLSGDDVGFRVDGFRGDVPSGAIVIRVNGEWIQAEIGGPGAFVR